MLKYLVMLFTACSLHASEVNKLLDRFQITEDSLITHDGVRYSPYPYESKLHSDLAYTVKDPDLAKTIHDAYLQHIAATFAESDVETKTSYGIPEDTLYYLKDPHFVQYFEAEQALIQASGSPISEKERFSKALLEVCTLFGHPTWSPRDALVNALMHNGSAAWLQQHSSQLDQFVQQASVQPYRLQQKEKNSPFRVVIITTSASGGNHAGADALHAFLSTQDGIESIVIDSESIALMHCPFMIATGSHTYDMIYSRMFQLTDDFTEILDRESISREIHTYIPSTVNKEFKNLLLSLKPDLIISTRDYAPEDFALATLGIPFRMVHINFEVALFLNGFYGRMPPEHMRSWMPSFEPSMFKSLFEWHQRIDLYDAHDDYDTLMQKISLIKYTPVAEIKRQFEHLGYPTNPQFSKIEPSDELRTKWGLSDKELAVYISMGKYGSGAIRDVVNELMQSQSNLPLKYIVICGKSFSLRDELLLLTQDDPRFIIHGLLTPSEMNEVMNISCLGIGKAGGGTSAETLVTHCPLLMMRYYPWEVANAKYLIEMGLGTNYDSTKPIIQQIEAIAQRDRPVKTAPHIFEGWQERLMTFIKENQ